MYIPEFWCGVIATVLAECVTLIGYSIYLYITGKDER